MVFISPDHKAGNFWAGGTGYVTWGDHPRNCKWLEIPIYTCGRGITSFRGHNLTISNHGYSPLTLPETNILVAPENRPKPEKEDPSST